MNVQRGFHRIGLVLAAPLLLAAVICACIATVGLFSAPEKGPWEKYETPAKLVLKGDAPTKGGNNPFADLIPKQPSSHQNRTDAWALLGVAVWLAAGSLIAYSIFFAIGWVIRGFRS